MKIETKELFDEMLTYKRRNSLPKLYMKHLLEALEKSVDDNFSISITRLLNWIKKSNRNSVNKDTYEFYHESDNGRYQQLFKYCTAIHNVFVLNENSIIWQESVSEEEKLEILDYIDKNYDWKMRVRARKKK
ncbi:hypothetical protein [Winogradskyella algicola]|uniref:hypothetical protein n=1 Tax=Winogradskyella algicola TaxID=2575815 RepID=UPI001108A4F5|nr:hypothetical protein [Winogradskyella algicola]